MKRFKKFALVTALATLATGAQATDQFEGNNTGHLTNAHVLDIPLYIPLPGKAGFPSYVDLNKFEKACAHLDQWRVTLTRLKNNDKTISLICETEDGGSVGVTTTENEATVSIHQTTQMNGKAITTLNNSFNIVVPLSFPIDDKCAEKIKEATEAKDSGSFGDVKIKFNPHGFEATCQSTCPVLSSFEANFKALDNFLTGHQ